MKTRSGSREGIRWEGASFPFLSLAVTEIYPFALQKHPDLLERFGDLRRAFGVEEQECGSGRKCPQERPRMNKNYTLNVRWTGNQLEDQYEASIPERSIVVTGTSVQEAIENASRAISSALAQETKAKPEVRQETVA